MSTLPSVYDGLDLRQRMLLWLFVREDPPVPVGELIERYRALANDNVEDEALRTLLEDLTRAEHIPYPLVERVENDGEEHFLLGRTRFGERFLFPLLEESDHPAKAVRVHIPILLLNGYRNTLLPQVGEVPPHNLEELQRVAAMCFLEVRYGRWNVDTERFLSLCPGPDFPTGGTLWSQDMRHLYEHGEEDLRLVGGAHVERYGQHPVLVVTDRLPNMSAAELYDDVSRRVAEGKLGSVHDIRLRQDGVQVRLEIVLEPGESVDGPLQSLMAGPLARSQAYLIAARNKQGKIVGIVDLLDEYISREEESASFEGGEVTDEWHTNLVQHPFLDLGEPWIRLRRTRVQP